MSKQQLETLTEPMYYILLALKKERHGYDIIKSTSELTNGRVTLGAGTVYSLLSRFEKEGLISKEREDERRKLYILTPKGANILEEEYERLQHQVADAKLILEGERRDK